MKYSKNNIEKFLLAMDAHLTKKYELLIIGGTAAALAYKSGIHTQDIDTIGSVSGLEKASALAREITGIGLILEQVGVWDAPYEYESRLVPFSISGLKMLSIKVPEIHDLILMKTLRGTEHDLDAIEQMHIQCTVSVDVLIDRMKNEMSHVMGNKKHVLSSFLAVVERLFGEVQAQKLEREFKGWEKR